MRSSPGQQKRKKKGKSDKNVLRPLMVCEGEKKEERRRWEGGERTRRGQGEDKERRWKGRKDARDGNKRWTRQDRLFLFVINSCIRRANESLSRCSIYNSCSLQKKHNILSNSFYFRISSCHYYISKHKIHKSTKKKIHIDKYHCFKKYFYALSDESRKYALEQIITGTHYYTGDYVEDNRFLFYFIN